jgi:hypothetical protein
VFDFIAEDIHVGHDQFAGLVLVDRLGFAV